MKKRGQVSQVFTYITIILVIGAIAIVGARSIMSMFNANCEAKTSDFNRQFTSFVDQYSDLGTVKIESFSAPCDVEEICFISSSAMVQTYTTDNLVISESVREGTYNVFLNGTFTTPVGKLEKLKTDGDVLTCVDVKNGNLKLKFSGQGRETLVEMG